MQRAKGTFRPASFGHHRTRDHFRNNSRLRALYRRVVGAISDGCPSSSTRSRVVPVHSSQRRKDGQPARSGVHSRPIRRRQGSPARTPHPARRSRPASCPTTTSCPCWSPSCPIDKGPQITSKITKAFPAVPVSRRSGRPGTPNDQTWIESLFGHIKTGFPTRIRSATWVS